MAESTDCLKKLEVWLRTMGLKSIEHQGNNRLRVSLKASANSSKYVVLVSSYGQDVEFESFVFKTVSGPAEQVNIFNTALLTMNSSIQLLTFAIVSVPNNGWRIILRASVGCGVIDPHYLRRLFDIYDNLYCDYLPKIKTWGVTKLGLKFDGSIFGDLGSWLDKLLE